MSRSTRTRLLGLTALIAGVLFFWFERRVLPGGAPSVSPQKGADLVESVIRLIREDYVEEPNARKTMQGGFQGLVNSLDALSSYLDKDAARKFADLNRPRYKDIGLILYKRASSFPLVVGLIEGSPAEKAGIRTGDLVSALDDRSTVLQGLQEIRMTVKDPEARPIKVRTIREITTKDIDITRADIYPRNYSFSEQKGTAGILTIHHLFPPLVDDLRKTLLTRLAGRKDPLILDLRRAFEGDNDEARKLINLFVQTEKAGSFEKRDGVKETFDCSEPAELGDIPLVLWVAPSTMGPAELAAACLRDLRKAKVVGAQTPGLTAEQVLFPLTDGDALILTTGVFSTASGEKIWSKGITPDIKIDFAKLDTKAFLEATAALRSRRP